MIRSRHGKITDLRGTGRSNGKGKKQMKRYMLPVVFFHLLTAEATSFTGYYQTGEKRDLLSNYPPGKICQWGECVPNSLYL